MTENMEYMGAMAKGIFGSEDLRKADWKQISIVFEVDVDGFVTGTYGYAYDAVGGFFAVAPEIDDVDEPVRTYREWLRKEGDKGFIKMLFQLDRETSKVNANFEFENNARWSVTSANIDKVVEQLRPSL